MGDAKISVSPRPVWGRNAFLTRQLAELPESLAPEGGYRKNITKITGDAKQNAIKVIEKSFNLNLSFFAIDLYLLR